MRAGRQYQKFPYFEPPAVSKEGVNCVLFTLHIGGVNKAREIETPVVVQCETRFTKQSYARGSEVEKKFTEHPFYFSPSYVC